MSESAIVAPFKGLWKRQSATSPEGKATAMLNALCVTEGDLKPRYGFRTVSNRPAGVTEFVARGFALLQGYDADFDGLSEFVTVEKRDGIVRPYSVDLSTGARTAITNGATALSLPDGMYQGVAYDDRSYWINPESNTPLYKHLIGTLTSWDTLVDTAYVPPAVSPVLGLNPMPPATRNIAKGAGADTITVSSADGVDMPPATATAAGVLEVTGNDNDNGVSHRTKTEIVFNAGEDWSMHGYIAVEVLSGVIFPAFERTNLKVEIKIGAAWVELDTKEIFNSAQTKVLIMARIRGVAGIGAVLGIRFSIGGYVARNTSGTAYKVNPIKLCGSFMEAKDNAVRLWDGADAGDGLEYAVRFCQAAGAVPVSAVTRNSVNKYAAAGDLLAEYGVRLGGRISITVAAQDGGLYSHVEVLRQNQAKDKWYRIGLLVNVDTAKMTDVIEDYELVTPTYPEVVLGSGGATGAKPPFSTRGIVAVFYYRGRLVWLRKGGKDNISLSRVGEPEETFDKNNIPPDSDLGRPVDLSMSPDLADEPIGGAEVGNGAIFVGHRGLYAMTGVLASEIQSPARIPGSTGGCGRFAFSKCIIQGQPGLAVMDKSGSIWFVTVEGAFSGDASIRPVELTYDLWKYAKTFLYDEQRDEYGMLDLSSIWMQWDEFEQALWVGAGRRALILRVSAERPEWEPYEYLFVNPSGATTESFCLDAGAFGSTAEDLLDGAVAWSDLGNPFASDDQYAQTASFGFGTLVNANTLRIAGLRAAQDINPGATLTSVKFHVEHQKTGDLAVSLKSAKPRIAGVLGANLLGAPATVGLTDEVLQLPLVALPSVVQLNGSLVDCELRYEQETWLPAWNVPANYTVTVSAEGTAASMVISVEYIAGGAKPPRVYLDIFSKVLATIAFDIGTAPGQIDGTATLDNGQGSAGTGPVIHRVSVFAPDEDPPPGDGTWPFEVSSTKKTAVPLVAGVGSLTLTRTGSGSLVVVSGSFINPRIEIEYSGSAVVVAAVPSVVRVDSVLVRPCYELTLTTEETSDGVGWKIPVFTSDRQKLLFRSSGQIDEAEFNSVAGVYIDGNNRDGGRPMPEGYWRSRLNILERTRIRHVEVEEREPSALSVTVDAETKPKSAAVRWAKFGILSQGHQQEVGVKFSESTKAVQAMRVIYEMLNKRFTR